MSSQVAHKPLRGPMFYGFGDHTPLEWPQGYYVSEADYNVLVARIAQLESELAEQCRLHGIGSNREAKQLTRIKQLEAALIALVDAAKALSMEACRASLGAPKGVTGIHCVPEIYDALGLAELALNPTSSLETKGVTE